MPDVAKRFYTNKQLERTTFLRDYFLKLKNFEELTEEDGEYLGHALIMPPKKIGKYERLNVSMLERHVREIFQDYSSLKRWESGRGGDAKSEATKRCEERGNELTRTRTWKYDVQRRLARSLHKGQSAANTPTTRFAHI